MARWRSLPVMLALALAACAGVPEAATPAMPEATPTAEATAIPPTATPAPSPTPPPTSTPAPTATATPAATPTPVATPTPRPTATPVIRSPLTGLDLAQPERARWQPLAVQIDNDPAARPHTGLAAASIIVETPTEAGLTRFTAIFLDQDAAVIGPVRSARLVNLELTPEYQALLVSAGGSEGVLARIGAAGLPYLNLLSGAGSAAGWRVPERPSPFNLYTSTERLRRAARELGLERPTTLAAGAFGPLADLPAAASAPAGLSLAIPYPHGAVRFTYDPASGGYQRLMNGQPHRDTADGTWLAPRNVVVQVAEITPTEIIEDFLGSRSLAVRLRGEGPLLLLRDGKRLRGTWRRDQAGDRTTYLDTEGRPLTLAPGQTWIALVPPGMIALDAK